MWKEVELYNRKGLLILEEYKILTDPVSTL